MSQNSVNLASERSVSLFLVGKPLHMSGDESRQAEYIKNFVAALRKNRYSSSILGRAVSPRSASAEGSKESGISIEKRARAVDRLAAVILLESYLDAIRSSSI